MEQKVIIVSADTWTMTDEKTGVVSTGCTIWYLPIEELKPIVNSDTSLGIKPCKASMPADFINTIKQYGAPCKATAHFVLRLSNGQQILKVENFSFSK